MSDGNNAMWNNNFEEDNLSDWNTFLNLSQELKQDQIVDSNSTPSPGSVVLDWEQENFSWNDVPLTLDELSEEPNMLGDLSTPTGPSPLPIPQEQQPPTPYTPSEASESDDSVISIAVAEPKYRELMKMYGLTDDSLADMSVVKLQKLCNNASGKDYDQLKSYRRTVLNRHYAKSSRNKKSNQATNMEQQIKTLKEENINMKAMIQERDRQLMEKDSVIEKLRKRSVTVEKCPNPDLVRLAAQTKNLMQQIEFYKTHRH